jgi:glutamate synthase (ferredoxin)
MPDDFFQKQCLANNINLPDTGNYAVGMTFLPSDDQVRNSCEKIIENIVNRNQQLFLGWRDVPINKSAVGILANNVMPEIRQFFIGLNKKSGDKLTFERRLYIIRKQIEYQIASNVTSDRSDFYIASLSSNTIVYKGLFRTNQLQKFYQDIEDFSLTSSFAMVHSRFSTNTLGSWELAHPYRYVVHNGEINTLRGNINWMNARESALKSKYFGDEIEHLKPIISANQSDTASIDNVLELLLHSGRSLPHAMLMMMPEAWSEKVEMEKNKKDFYEYHSALMEPWDGPALIVGTDGKKVCAILDRNGLRPCRYLVTKDNLLVMGSESGVLDIPGWMRHLYKTSFSGISSTPDSEPITSKLSFVTKYLQGRNPFLSRIAHTFLPSVPTIKAGPSQGSIKAEWYS